MLVRYLWKQITEKTFIKSVNELIDCYEKEQQVLSIIHSEKCFKVEYEIVRAILNVVLKDFRTVKTESFKLNPDNYYKLQLLQSRIQLIHGWIRNVSSGIFANGDKETKYALTIPWDDYMQTGECFVIIPSICSTRKSDERCIHESVYRVYTAKFCEKWLKPVEEINIGELLDDDNAFERIGYVDIKLTESALPGCKPSVSISIDKHGDDVIFSKLEAELEKL